MYFLPCRAQFGEAIVQFGLNVVVLAI